MIPAITQAIITGKIYDSGLWGSFFGITNAEIIVRPTTPKAITISSGLCREYIW